MADTQPLDDILAFIKREWPDLEIDQARIDAWYAEIASGTGRTAAELRLDVIEYVVGDERVDQFVADAFSDRGIDPATGDETEDERVQRISDELQTGEKTFSGLGTTLDEHRTVAKEGTAYYGDQVMPEGLRLVNVDGTFYVVGTVYGVDFAYFVGDRDAVDETFGGVDGFASVSTVTQAEFDGADVLEVGTVDEIVGSSESLQAQFDRDLRAAGLEAPPQWLVDDQEAMLRYVTAVNEGWSAERMWTSLSTTSAFKNRFKGLDVVMDQLATTSWVAGIAEYTARERELRSELLANRGPQTDVSQEYVSSLIAAGWEPAETAELLALERRIKDNPEALDNINQILAFQGLPTLDADDFILFLQDQDQLTLDPSFVPSDLYEGVNDALRFQALLDEGLEVSLEFASELGDGYSEDIGSVAQYSERARIAAIEVARNADELELRKYGLQRDDVIAAMFGEESPSGKASSEVTELLEKLGRERSKAATGFASAASYTDALGRLRVQGMSNL